ncbi:uncharacterized protein I303_104065 [Kwoniella dejecticola CBS 10117]|uniref:Uncharacterized protein n=1 Tax=Kwoniella dejecticola CBS 10117 TaxID=1296121 RepID=A0A1A6A8H8_9TREE|nr:uncharacterized protein I303_04084 [Kwoniella dejecticola CBS 10117]OBR86360.1 hypothetical protein I303_04084 [Kwoniella dejecticola CBS 10117]
MLFVIILIPLLVSSAFALKGRSDSEVRLRVHGFDDDNQQCVLPCDKSGNPFVEDYDWDDYTSHGSLSVNAFAGRGGIATMKWNLTRETKSDTILSLESLNSYPFFALDAGNLFEDDRVTIKPKDEESPSQKWTYQDDKRISVEVNGTTKRCLTCDMAPAVQNRVLITTLCEEGAQDPETSRLQVWDIPQYGQSLNSLKETEGT